MLKPIPKSIEDKVNNTQTYLQNPPKMGPKSLPGTLQGALLQKVRFFPPKFVPMVPKWEPRAATPISFPGQRNSWELLAQSMQNLCICHTYFIHIPYVSHKKAMPKLNPKKHKK